MNVSNVHKKDIISNFIIITAYFNKNNTSTSVGNESMIYTTNIKYDIVIGEV